MECVEVANSTLLGRIACSLTHELNEKGKKSTAQNVSGENSRKAFQSHNSTLSSIEDRAARDAQRLAPLHV